MRQIKHQTVTYQIMHGDRITACVDTKGRCRIYEPEFLPFSLYLEENEADFDVLFNNLANFYFWCASRVLTLDRAYAKEILSSIGAPQASTDKDRAAIALSYHCLSLLDVFWVRTEDEKVSFREINLYENSLDDSFVDVALKGRQMTIQNSHLIADDLSTPGMFPKAWIRREGTFCLLKDGSAEAVENELLASRICQCFDCPQVRYTGDIFDGQPVSKSRILTSLDYSIVSEEAFEIYAQNHDLDPLDYILGLDAHAYYMMNILDYLVGNTDRHWGNWGFLVRNRDNQPIRLHDLMDFNRAFSAYDSLDGGRCLTVRRGAAVSQREAAVDAAKKVGLNQLRDVEQDWFGGRTADWDMFRTRLELLRKSENSVA